MLILKGLKKRSVAALVITSAKVLRTPGVQEIFNFRVALGV